MKRIIKNRVRNKFTYTFLNKCILTAFTPFNQYAFDYKLLLTKISNIVFCFSGKRKKGTINNNEIEQSKLLPYAAYY